MISSTKSRLVSLASASALVATLGVASMPAATLAAEGDTVTINGRDLTVMHFNPTAPITGDVNASAYDIGVYFDDEHPGTVTNADIHGAKWYGVVAEEAKVNVTGSKVHDIGGPFDGVQKGRAIVYIDGASGKISGNQVYDFQKNGIEVHGPSSATIEKNVVTGRGDVPEIAQNGIVIRDGGRAVVKNNTVSQFRYTGEADTYATGLLNYANGLGSFAASGNKFAGNDVNIDGATGTPGGTVRP